MNTEEDKAYKRLVRLLVGSWVAMAILLFAVVSLLSYQIADVKNIALDADGRVVIGPIGPAGQGLVGPQGEQGVQGVQGQQGVQGEQGVAGQNGQDGKDGAKGDTGSQGEPGAPGRVVYVRSYWGQLQCRYEGADEWTSIEECSQ